jgi:transposase
MRAYTGGGPDLIWYGAAGNRTKAAITGFGILDGYRGVLVRDDYGGYLSYDAGLAGVQQCLAHLYRYLDDACATGPQSQVWTRQAGDALRAAATAVRAARAAARDSLDSGLLARLRHSYDQAVAFGISVNLSRPWHKGSHPGLILARRLKRKASQVWLFATRFDVPRRTTDARTPSAATSSPRKSAAAGAPSRPCSATAASAPTSPPPAATAATHSPPSATHSTATPGCRPTRRDQLTRHP